VKIKLGLKALSLAPAMLVSLAMISGCNDEGASSPSGTPSTSPPPGAGAGKPADKKPDIVTPPAPSADKGGEPAKTK
jgi:hypothetical protein